MCYAKYHNINKDSLLKNYSCWQIVSYGQLMHVTLWNLEASNLGPLQIVHVTLNTINNVDQFRVFSPNLKVK